MALHTVEVVIAGFDGGYQPAFKKSGPFPVQSLFVSVIPKHQAKKFPTEPIGFADYLTALKQADDVAASILCFKSASPFASAVCLYVVASAHPLGQASAVHFNLFDVSVGHVFSRLRALSLNA